MIQAGDASKARSVTKALYNWSDATACVNFVLLTACEYMILSTFHVPTKTPTATCASVFTHDFCSRQTIHSNLFARTHHSPHTKQSPIPSPQPDNHTTPTTYQTSILILTKQPDPFTHPQPIHNNVPLRARRRGSVRHVQVSEVQARCMRSHSPSVKAHNPLTDLFPTDRHGEVRHTRRLLHPG